MQASHHKHSSEKKTRHLVITYAHSGYIYDTMEQGNDSLYYVQALADKNNGARVIESYGMPKFL